MVGSIYTSIKKVMLMGDRRILSIHLGTTESGKTGE